MVVVRPEAGCAGALAEAGRADLSSAAARGAGVQAATLTRAGAAVVRPEAGSHEARGGAVGRTKAGAAGHAPGARVQAATRMRAVTPPVGRPGPGERAVAPTGARKPAARGARAVPSTVTPDVRGQARAGTQAAAGMAAAGTAAISPRAGVRGPRARAGMLKAGARRRASVVTPAEGGKVATNPGAGVRGAWGRAVIVRARALAGAATPCPAGPTAGQARTRASARLGWRFRTTSPPTSWIRRPAPSCGRCRASLPMRWRGLLVAASQEPDAERGYEYALQARKLAARVGIVRETGGVVAYRAGRWAEALAELRTARRLTGRASYLPLMADSERALGRLDRALAIVHDPDVRALDRATQIELLIVESGIRRDEGRRRRNGGPAGARAHRRPAAALVGSPLLRLRGRAARRRPRGRGAGLVRPCGRPGRRGGDRRG